MGWIRAAGTNGVDMRTLLWVITTLEEYGRLSHKHFPLLLRRQKVAVLRHLCISFEVLATVPDLLRQHVTNIEKDRKRRTQVLYVFYELQSIVIAHRVYLYRLWYHIISLSINNHDRPYHTNSECKG